MSLGSGTVYLVGFMASGKTTAGRLAATSLGWPFVDLDHCIEAEAGRSIEALFAEEGEAAFRSRERSALQAVAGGRAVVATGGGAAVLEENRDCMRRTGLSLWLRVPFGVLWTRAKGDPSGVRPLLQDEGSLRELLERRTGAYAFADHIIDPGDASPLEVSRHIVDLVRLWDREGQEGRA